MKVPSFSCSAGRAFLFLLSLVGISCGVAPDPQIVVQVSESAHPIPFHGPSGPGGHDYHLTFQWTTRITETAGGEGTVSSVVATVMDAATQQVYGSSRLGVDVIRRISGTARLEAFETLQVNGQSGVLFLLPVPQVVLRVTVEVTTDGGSSLAATTIVPLTTR